MPLTNIKTIKFDCERTDKSIAEEFLGANPPVGIVAMLKARASKMPNSEKYNNNVHKAVRIV